jgi:hypothetical protein
MFNEVSDLVFKKLKAKIEELGRRGFQLQKEFPPLRGGYEFRGLISYDTDSCNNDEEPMIILNANMWEAGKIRVLSLLLAHATSFLGKDFRVGMVILNHGSGFFQEEESVYGKNLKGYNIHPLYKEHIGQLARSLVNGIKGEIYEEAV